MNDDILLHELIDELPEFNEINLKLNIHQEVKQSFLEFKTKHFSRGQKGLEFEKLITSLFPLELFDVLINKQTSSNEIDIIVSCNIYTKYLRAKSLIPTWFPDIFIIECKNYNKPVGVTYVSKFYGLLNLSNNIKYGFFISTKPITGYGHKYWKDSTAFLKKVNLGTNKYIIDLNYEYICKILLEKERVNVFDILQSRKLELDLDINNYKYNDVSHPLLTDNEFISYLH